MHTELDAALAKLVDTASQSTDPILVQVAELLVRAVRELAARVQQLEDGQEREEKNGKAIATGTN